MRKLILYTSLCASCLISWLLISRLGKTELPPEDSFVALLGGGTPLFIPEEPARALGNNPPSAPPAATPPSPENRPEKAQSAQPDPVAPRKAEERLEYVVQSGDTLWSIARRKLGAASRYREIAEWNQIREPYTVRSGQKLLLKPPR